jgi:hypothetical protein
MTIFCVALLVFVEIKGLILLAFQLKASHKIVEFMILKYLIFCSKCRPKVISLQDVSLVYLLCDAKCSQNIEALRKCVVGKLNFKLRNVFFLIARYMQNQSARKTGVLQFPPGEIPKQKIFLFRLKAN